MSSYASIFTLEEIIKERIRVETQESIKNLSMQLKEKKETAPLFFSSQITQTVFEEDETVREKEGSFQVSDQVFLTLPNHAKNRENMDFSSLLNVAEGKKNRLQKELESLVQSIENRKIISEQDEKAREEINIEVDKIMTYSTLDIEEKITLLKEIINHYLSDSTILSSDDIEKIRNEYIEYCAMCKMLGMEPVEKIPYRVKNEHKRLSSFLLKQRENEYVMNVIESIMKELGCKTENDGILFGAVGQVFSVKTEPFCNVFAGIDENQGIMFEPVGNEPLNGPDQNMHLQTGLEHICSLYEKVEQKAAAQGVILKRDYMTSASSADVVDQQTIERAEKSEVFYRRRKKNMPGQRVLQTENNQ